MTLRDIRICYRQDFQPGHRVRLGSFNRSISPTSFPLFRRSSTSISAGIVITCSLVLTLPPVDDELNGDSPCGDVHHGRDPTWELGRLPIRFRLEEHNPQSIYAPSFCSQNRLSLSLVGHLLSIPDEVESSFALVDVVYDRFIWIWALFFSVLDGLLVMFMASVLDGPLVL
ncbi:hypothetical protein BDN72DRAFT_682707 [Pluteus cervinus]|uniref:Uncharacterized protein n=1 Tax=Pluteus cervinus TaxID=181527 RepID=A0ACD3ARQ6_9AGAR|nr:hypothetical protein BDN72DRAFT_682707 [Pluteus cervinus]